MRQMVSSAVEGSLGPNSQRVRRYWSIGEPDRRKLRQAGDGGESLESCTERLSFGTADKRLEGVMGNHNLRP